MLKLFIAIPIPDEVKTRLEKVQTQWKRILPSVRWTPLQQMHLTLLFLGETPEDSIRQVVEAMHESMREMEPFTIEAGALGCFPSENRPRVLWAGLKEGREHTLHMNERLRHHLDERGILFDGKPYNPHLTLGRCKVSPRQISYPEHPESFGSFELETIHLYESKLSAAGSKYLSLATVSMS